MSDDAEFSDGDDGANTFPLPEGYTLLEWAASLKCLNADGEVALLNVTSENLTPWESLGMCHSLFLDAQSRMQTSYEYEDDDSE
jgi:hypothetical protein